jgi:hypothetical protein
LKPKYVNTAAVGSGITKLSRIKQAIFAKNHFFQFTHDELCEMHGETNSS